MKKVQEAYPADGKFSLYNAHIEHYRALLHCDTLDEAKELYPEFSGVKDACDIPYEEMSYSMKQIKRGERGIDIGDLSLQLLKNYYGKAISISKHEEENFGFSNKVLINMFDILNIPKMNKKYSKLLYYQDPDLIETISSNVSAYAA